MASILDLQRAYYLDVLNYTEAQAVGKSLEQLQWEFYNNPPSGGGGSSIAQPLYVKATSSTVWETVADALTRAGLASHPGPYVFDSSPYATHPEPTEMRQGDIWRKRR